MRTEQGGVIRKPDRADWVSLPDPFATASRLISSHPVWAGILAVGMFLAGLCLPTVHQ